MKDKLMRVCELKSKQVINEDDCKILGYVIDVDFDIKTGCINYIVVPGPARLCGILGREFEYIIPFQCIKSMGPDIILVSVCLERIKQKCI